MKPGYQKIFKMLKALNPAECPCVIGIRINTTNKMIVFADNDDSITVGADQSVTVRSKNHYTFIPKEEVSSISVSINISKCEELKIKPTLDAVLKKYAR